MTKTQVVAKCALIFAGIIETSLLVFLLQHIYFLVEQSASPFIIIPIIVIFLIVALCLGILIFRNNFLVLSIVKQGEKLEAKVLERWLFYSLRLTLFLSGLLLIYSNSHTISQILTFPFTTMSDFINQFFYSSRWSYFKEHNYMLFCVITRLLVVIFSFYLILTPTNFINWEIQRTLSDLSDNNKDDKND